MSSSPLAAQAVDIRRQLRGDGLRLRMGPFVAQISTALPDVAASIESLYGHYPLASDHDFVDFHVAIRRTAGWRRFGAPLVSFEFDGDSPFNPLPGDQGFPLLEWGLNWCVYGQCHQYLIVHAAVVARGSLALLLPAPSGSGKSTLCAGLALRGWRLLSDELALFRPSDGRIQPLPRPVSLKNRSIDVIRSLHPDLNFGSMVSETAKGVVAHFAAPDDAVSAAGEFATLRWVVLPRYVEGAPARLTPIPRAEAFMSLIENSFNYDVFGPEGFELLGRVLDTAEAFRFEYGSLEEAEACFDRLAMEGAST